MPRSTIQTLRASAAHTGAGTVTGDGVKLNRAFHEMVAQLTVSAAATDAVDTLDVLVDTSFDGGSKWVNIGHFTQVLGNGGAKTFVMSFCNANPGSSAVIDVSSDVSAGVTRQIGFGQDIRYRSTLVDADADASFTYSLTAFFK